MSSSQFRFGVDHGARRFILALVSLIAILPWAPAFAAAGGDPYPLRAAIG